MRIEEAPQLSNKIHQSSIKMVMIWVNLHALLH